MIYMEEIKMNEKKIIDALKKLQDSVFGLEARYSEFCYTQNETAIELDILKTEAFFEELLSYVRTDSNYTYVLEEHISDFLNIVIRYIDCTFSASEQKLSSIKKIADSVRKEHEEQVSTFDILITDQKDCMDSDTYALYEKFTKEIAHIDQDAFYVCIRHALEKFADVHKTNCLYSEEMTIHFAHKISRLANEIQFEYRHGAPARRR